MIDFLSNVFCLILLYLSYCSAQVTDVQPGCAEGEVRLVGGPNEFEGRVEICVDAQWGQVCGRGWQREAGEVVCRQMGFNVGDGTAQQNKAEVTAGSRLGSGDSPYVVSQVTCTGSENRLDNCSYTRLNQTDECQPGPFNALVLCTDRTCFDSPQSVRLVGGNADNEGRVEICTEDGFRAALCVQGWDQKSAQTVCRELGLLQNGNAVPVHGNSTIRYFKNINVSCNGSEESLSACQTESTELANCRPDAGVVCPGMFPTGTPTTIATDTLTTTPNALTDGNITNTATTSHFTTLSETSSEPITTTMVGETDPSDDPLLSDMVVIILGIVGGLILLLLIGIMILLLVLVITLRKQKKPKHQLQNLKFNGSEIHKDAEKTLNNDLYTLNSEPELSKVPDPRPYSSSSISEEIHPYECAELEDIRSRARTGTFTSRRELTPTDPSVASTPALLSPAAVVSSQHSIPSVLRELTPVIPSEFGTNSDPHVYAQPSSTTNGAVTDVQGYASLESPSSTVAYDTVGDVKKANPNCYIEQSNSSQYQTPQPNAHHYTVPEPSEYQTPVYDKLVETPLPLNTPKQEYNNEMNSERDSTRINQDYAVPEGSDVTHDYDVPPVESPQPVDIMELANNDQNPYAVLEQNIV